MAQPVGTGHRGYSRGWDERVARRARRAHRAHRAHRATLGLGPHGGVL